MVFSSVAFLFYFLPIVLLIYFSVPRKFKNLMLFLASLIFYAWGEPIYISIMLFSTVFDYINGLLIEKFDESIVKKRIVLIVSVVGNLAILGFFKYTDFFLGTINNIFNLDMNLLNIALPIGISFYTFQTMSYTIDVYRKVAPVQKNIISFGAYVTLFPQLIAGPIVRYGTIAEQLNYREETFDKFGEGVKRFIIGLSKKVLLANNIGMLWDTVKATPFAEMSTLTAWLGIIAFALQIYFDFSGYSDMAIGLGKMFGFDFMENFNYPYISRNITDFWRRWQMSLGAWFREYVYIPLGGSRVKIPRMYINIMIVWFLTGLWHGASWNFVIWGLFYGVLLLIEKSFLLKVLSKAPKFVGHIYFNFFMLLATAIFCYDNISEGMVFLKIMFGVEGVGFIDSTFIYNFLSYLPMLIILIIGCTPIPKNIFNKISQRKAKIIIPICILLGLFICTIYLVDSTYNPFLYFRF